MSWFVLNASAHQVLSSRRTLWLSLCCLLGSWAVVSSTTLANDGNIISTVQANAAGLTVHWSTQVNLGLRQQMIDAELVIDEDRSTTYFEITGGGLRELLSDKDIGPNGQVLGLAGAEEFAAIRQEIMQAQLKFRNSDEVVQINKHTVPKSTLYVLTDNGTIHALDGETGALLWLNTVGNRHHPSIGLSANKRLVAAVNGSRVFCLDAVTGKLLFEHQCTNAITAGPAVADDTVFVPTISGSILALPIDDKGRGGLPLNGVGAAMSAPRVAGSIVAWTTNRGYLTVAPTTTGRSMKYRIKAAGEFVAPPTANQNRLFAVALSGFIYAIDDRSGELLWNFSLGERVSRAPIPLGDKLYVFSDENRLFKFDAATGATEESWKKPLEGLTEFAGASSDRLYARDPVGNLVVIDRQSGLRMGEVSAKTPFTAIENFLTDRIYVCTAGGMIQCLREINRIRPMFHNDESAEMASTTADPSASPATDPAASPRPANPDTNPFGGSGSQQDADPFGGGGNNSNKSDKDKDPFGNGQ